MALIAFDIPLSSVVLACSAGGISLLAWASYWPVSKVPALRRSMWPTWALFVLSLPPALGAVALEISGGVSSAAMFAVLATLVSFGLFVLVFLLMLLIPRSAGRPQVDHPLPEFDVLFADGKRYAPTAMAQGGPVLIVFFRGFW